MRVHSRRDRATIIQVGISYVSTRNALMNLESEIPDWSFDRIRNDAREAWERDMLNGKPMEQSSISHWDIVSGGSLVFVPGNQ